MIGETVGSYRVTGILGKGGMGVVYTAEHPLLGRRAVVKMLLPHLSRKTDMVERFFTEARASTLIKHPGIVDIFDFGYHPSGSAFIVMEFLEGETLSSRLRRRGRMESADAAALGVQMASALGAAHAQGMVHRDLKPDNLFLEPDPGIEGGERVKVLDFGIAKLVGAAEGAHRTQSGVVMGTPLYMAPEQCQSAASVDGRADIYALGCILFELVAGRPPFTGESIAQLVTSHMYQRPPSLAELEPRVAPELQALVERCLAKDVDDRPESMEDVAAELARIANVRRPVVVADPRRTPEFQASDTLLPVTAEASTTFGRSAAEVVAAAGEKRRRRGLGVALSAMGAAAALVGAILLGQRGDAPAVSAGAGGVRGGDVEEVVVIVDAGVAVTQVVAAPEPPPEPKAEPKAEPKPEPKPERRRTSRPRVVETKEQPSKRVSNDGMLDPFPQ